MRDLAYVPGTGACFSKGRMLLIPGTGNGERGTGNGERGTGNGERGTGVWELMYSGNPLESSKWRSKQK